MFSFNKFPSGKGVSPWSSLSLGTFRNSKTEYYAILLKNENELKFCYFSIVPYNEIKWPSALMET